jgi:hypothetical protein
MRDDKAATASTRSAQHTGGGSAKGAWGVELIDEALKTALTRGMERPRISWYRPSLLLSCSSGSADEPLNPDESSAIGTPKSVEGSSKSAGDRISSLIYWHIILNFEEFFKVFEGGFA